MLSERQKLLNKIDAKKSEIAMLEGQASAYFELAGSPVYVSSPIVDVYAYNEYRKLAKKINSKRASLEKLNKKLNELS